MIFNKLLVSVLLFSVWLRRIMTRLLSALAVAWLSASPALAVTVDVKLNGKFDNRYLVGGQANGAISGGYSLHAGAEVFGTPPTIDVRHDPAQTGARDTTFPVKLTPTYMGPGRETIPMPGPAFPGNTYASRPYFTVVNGVRVPNNGDTDYAFATGANPAGAATTDALARETAQILLRPNNQYQIDTTGSVATLTKSNEVTSPGGNVGRIMLDPWNYGPSSAGNDELDGTLTLSGDLKVHIDDSLGQAFALFQAGSNMRTTVDPFNPLGDTDSGLPAIYRLGLIFHPGSLSTPDILFTYNSSYQFFDPSDLVDPLSPGSIEAFVENRILSNLVPGVDEVTLAGDLPIIAFRGKSLADVADLQLNQEESMLAQSIPEPGTLFLMLAGLVSAVIFAEYRRKHSGDLRLHSSRKHRSR